MGAAQRWMALWAGAGVLLGAALVGLLQDEPLAPAAAPPGPRAPRPAAAPDSGRDAGLAALREQLAAQQTLTRALQAEITELRGELKALAGRLEGAEDGDAGRDDAPDPAPRNWFDGQALLDLGLAPAEVARLRERFDAHQLDLLYLRDEAAREGWQGRPRFANEVAALRAALREELGEEDTDRLLWATGQFNRIELASLLTGSPAGAAGLEAGDVVIAYDEARIFDGRTLQTATRLGEPGELVALDVLRDGVERRFYVPRGPLGAQLRPTRRPPEPG